MDDDTSTSSLPQVSSSREGNLSPGADRILDVTPVNSFSANETPPSNRQAHRRNEDAFSSSSEDDDDDDALSYNGSGFRSNEGDIGTLKISIEEGLQQQTQQGTHKEAESEWDKALQKGKANTGHASKFFTEGKEDEEEFLTRAESNVLQEASSAAVDSFDTSASSKNDPSTFETKTTVVSTQPTTKTSDAGGSMRPVGKETEGKLPVDTSTGTGASQKAAPPASTNKANESASMSVPPPPPPSASIAVIRPHPTDNLSAGVLPDVLIAMRQRLESMTLFDSDMMRLAATNDDDPMLQESIESLKRSFHQSISAAVLVSLSHKRYERRRLAAMEIEKVVRSLLHQGEVERVRAILLLLSDDYVRSTSEDARKGGVVALAACAVGIKKAAEKENPVLQECRDLILASVVHACQDHNQRVRYYATESLFNVVKVMPVLAIQHFFILFEILRSLYADVEVDVRSGAEMLDKKLKEVIVHAINSGTFTVEACVPVFARFVYIRNKATKRLTLTWLQELSEKLVGAPILEFLHLFLSGIFQMVSDPTLLIRQSALAFLQSVLPKILVLNTDTPLEKDRMAVDFDKILQSLVSTMEHPDPFVRKVSMYWMSRIVKAHIGEDTSTPPETPPDEPEAPPVLTQKSPVASAAAVSVRNSVPHVLPGILLSIGDTHDGKSVGAGSNKDSFLPDQTTRSLAEQTNTCLQASVRRDGEAYVQHLDGFIIALREELDSPGGLNARHTTAIDRSPYRVDVSPDGNGIERPGWFRESVDTQKPASDDSLIMSRLCALHWIIVLYESVVPELLKADYAREFVYAIIHQFVHKPPKEIVLKSLEVLAKITIVGEEEVHRAPSLSMAKIGSPVWASNGSGDEDTAPIPMTEKSIEYALGVLGAERKKHISRDREVFWALIQLHSFNESLLRDLTDVITYMCKLQPSEFVMISFAVELDRFIRRKTKSTSENPAGEEVSQKDLKVVSFFVQHMNHVLLNAAEARDVRNALKDCIGSKRNTERDRQLTRVFHILLHSFSHNLASTLSLCLWCGAYRTGSLFLNQIDPLDIDLVFLLEVDLVVELLERPLFRHLHVRMLEREGDNKAEGSGAMLFKALKALAMIIPQSTCFSILRDRLCSVSRFRQSTIRPRPVRQLRSVASDTELYVNRVLHVRSLHCHAAWKAIRVDSLETPPVEREAVEDEGADKRSWLGYASKEDEMEARKKYLDAKHNLGKASGLTIQEINNEYDDFETMRNATDELPDFEPNPEAEEEDPVWKQYWADTE